MKDIITTFKALSDETRLRILSLLLARECCVCEVMQALEISQTRASRNLGILEEAGFLKSHRDGLWIIYNIDWEGANQFTAALARLLKESPLNDKVLQQDRERLKKARRTGICCSGKPVAGTVQ